MQDASYEELRNDFRNQRGFNDLFEVLRKALEQRIDDVDLYRELLWNNSLKSEELLFFAKRIGDVFPGLGFEIYMWLANIFESRVGDVDGVELSFLCLKKAAEFNPKSDEPYLNACNLYNPDLKVPTVESILLFLRNGVGRVADPFVIFERLAVFYKMLGNDELFNYYRQKSRR